MDFNKKDFLPSEGNILESHDKQSSAETNIEKTYSFDMGKFDVTFPQDMNLKKFDFHDEQNCFTEVSKLQSEFIKSNEIANSMEHDNNSVNLIRKFEGFYEEMKTRLNLLKNTPVIKSKTPLITPKVPQDTGCSAETRKLFKHLKNTPQVQEKLQYIQDLDEEIKNIISDYKNEREQRLQTQLELCNDICKNALPERNTQSFLDMCHFEFSETGEDSEEEDDTLEDCIGKMNAEASKSKSNNFMRNYSDTFVKRNIEVAKTGILAGSSLTDEEKSRIELLLTTEMTNPYVDMSENLTESCSTTLDSLTNSSLLNAYSFLDTEREKLVDIDKKLEKFADDEKESEKIKENINDISDVKDGFLLKQTLKRINEQIKELRDKDEKEMEDKKVAELVNGNDNVEDINDLECKDDHISDENTDHNIEEKNQIDFESEDDNAFDETMTEINNDNLEGDIVT